MWRESEALTRSLTEAPEPALGEPAWVACLDQQPGDRPGIEAAELTKVEPLTSAEFETSWRSSPSASTGWATIGPAVTVFGSARTPPEHGHYRLMRDVGAALGKAGYAVITQGGAARPAA